MLIRVGKQVQAKSLLLPPLKVIDNLSTWGDSERSWLRAFTLSNGGESRNNGEIASSANSHKSLLHHLITHSAQILTDAQGCNISSSWRSLQLLSKLHNGWMLQVHLPGTQALGACRGMPLIRPKSSRCSRTSKGVGAFGHIVTLH